MDKIFKQMIDKGLAEIAREDIHEATKRYAQLVELNYTKVQTEPDMFASWLRLYRDN